MKRMMMTIAGICLFAPLAQAVDAGWSNTATAVQTWTTAANWTNVTDGTALEQPPTGAADTVTFPYVDQMQRTVELCGNVTAEAGSFAVASVAGARQWCLRIPAYAYAWNTTHHTFAFDDVNGFKGTWRALGPQRTLAFAAATGVQTLETLSANDRIVLDVRNAGAEVRANVVSESGAIEKKGAGQLTLGLMQHPNQDVYLGKGKLVLEGVKADLGALFARAAVHLDASRADTMLGYLGEDGRHYVTNWAHASGGTVSAELWDNSDDTIASHVKKPHAPFVNSNEVSTTGLPLMDFGSNSEKAAERLGPTNCTLRLSKAISNVREVFYIDMHTEGQAPSNYTLCNTVNNDSIIFSGNDDYAFKYYDSFPAMNEGVVAFNGVEKFPVMASGKLQIPRPKDVYSPTWNSLTLTSVALTRNVKVTHLCCGSLYATSCGGMRVAEVLVYTNALTQAERREINAYLMRKWFARARSDVSTLRVADDGTVSVSVPAGRVAHVDTVALAGTTLVKEGDGTLEIGCVEPRDATVSVRAGRVKVTSTGAEIETKGPAGTPYFWYDADADLLVTNEAGGVTGWKDCRTDLSRQASVPSGKTAAEKVAVSIDGVSHTAVAIPNGSYLSLPYRKANSDVCYMKEYFVVARFDSDAYAKARVAVGMEKIRRNARGSCNFLGADTCDEDWGGSAATVNGVSVDPFGPANTSSPLWEGGAWYVLSLSSNGTGDGAVLRVGGTIAASEANGGVTIGEMLAYDTALTADERRNTVAYLMKKWLNRDHPDAEDRGTPTYAYAATDPVRIITDDDVAVRGYTGGNGTVVKDGSGTATLADYVSSFTALSVADGELKLTRAGFADKSAIHLDATDASTITSFIGPDGATNITKWADVRGNGAYASTGGNATIYSTNTLLQTVETRNGEVRQVVDFRNFRNREGANLNRDAAAMLFDGSHRLTNVAEAHEIFSDAHGYANAITFGSHVTHEFERGLSGAWLRDWAEMSHVARGYLAIDGRKAAYNSVISDGFHLLSIAPTSTVSLTALAFRKENDKIGGCYVGEILIYTTPLAPVERTYVQQSLMRKWFGDTVPVPEWTNEVASVAVAAGAKMTFAEGSVVVTPALTGSGTISAAGVAGVESLALETADGLPVAKTIEGKIAFAPAVTLTLGEGLRRIPAGTYTLLTATDGILGADEANWTIVSDASDRRVLKVVAEGNVLKLCVEKKGMVMVVR